MIQQFHMESLESAQRFVGFLHKDLEDRLDGIMVTKYHVHDDGECTFEVKYDLIDEED